jgi:hypothetical protein
MKKIFLFLILSSSAWGTTSIINNTISAANCSSSTGTSCASPTLLATTIGNVGVFCLELTSGSVTAGPTQGGTWTQVTNSPFAGASSRTVACYYTTFTSSVTSISATVTTGTGRVIWYYEATSTISGVVWTLDSSNFTNSTSPCTNCAGQALTLTGANDTIYQISLLIASAIAGSPTYLNFVHGGSGNAVAGAAIQNTTNGGAPTWTNASITNGIVGAIAVTENAPSTTVEPRHHLVEEDLVGDAWQDYIREWENENVYLVNLIYDDRVRLRSYK